MLVLLPPSEGKTAPVRGRCLDLSTLSLPELDPTRRRVLGALTALCAGEPAAATNVLGLGPTQVEEVTRNARLFEAPTARTDAVYSGVLFSALDLATLDVAARRRATRQLVVASALFGLVRPPDRIPAYRLSGAVRLPALGPLAAVWRAPFAKVVPDLVGDGLLLDLRSATYAGFWRPSGRLAAQTVTVRVLVERAGRRSIVSHANKATKGRLVRALLVAGAAPRTPAGLVDVLRDLGWRVESSGSRLDVVVETD